MFVFRNNTIERFFPKDYIFSGYDDVSVIPDADSYVWFYQAPIKFDNKILADEIDSFSSKFEYIVSKIGSDKLIVAFTMELLYHIDYIDNDWNLKFAIERYNNTLVSIANIHKNVKIIDINDFTKDYQSAELFDWKFYFLSQMGLNPRLSSQFMIWWQKKLSSISLKRKKCLILDLDNTLWGGVLGEDGIDGIKIGGDYPGKAFLYWQEALLELSKKGIILAICTKNNENDVKELWNKNPFMVLKKEHFSSLRINWNDKASNIREIAVELNIGLDSMVFVDDNPTERELIKQELPMVCVPDFPAQPYDLMTFYRYLVDEYFRVYALTDEDLNKTEQYKANANRVQAQKTFTDMESFLKSLEIKLKIEEANEHTISRISQMTQKTNQFNLTSHRYTESDISTMLNSGAKMWTLSVSDKFGDNGITGLIIIKDNIIDTFLMSCRVLGKDIEYAFLKYVLSQCGLNEIEAKYIPTEKNVQVKDFYEKLEFNLISDFGGVKQYLADVKSLDLNIKDYYSIN